MFVCCFSFLHRLRFTKTIWKKFAMSLTGYFHSYLNMVETFVCAFYGFAIALLHTWFCRWDPRCWFNDSNRQVTIVFSFFFQTQQLHPGVHRSSGTYIPRLCSRSAPVVAAVCLWKIFQWGHWWWGPRFEHQICALCNSHDPLRSKHVRPSKHFLMVYTSCYLKIRSNLGSKRAASNYVIWGKSLQSHKTFFTFQFCLFFSSF